MTHSQDAGGRGAGGEHLGRGLRIAVVAARFNGPLTRRLVDGARAELARLGVAPADVAVEWVPGSFELPVAAAAAARGGRFDAVVCLGVIVKGGTDHYRFVAEGATQGLRQVAVDTGVPVAFGVLTCERHEDAQARAGGWLGDKGAEAAASAVETARVVARLKGA